MKKTITIEGMSCKHCVEKIKSALLSLKGVKEVDVALAEKSTKVSGDNLHVESLKTAIENIGYTVTSVVDEK